jgi:hypothetical protein
MVQNTPLKRDALTLAQFLSSLENIPLQPCRVPIVCLQPPRPISQNEGPELAPTVEKERIDVKARYVFGVCGPIRPVLNEARHPDPARLLASLQEMSSERRSLHL